MDDEQSARMMAQLKALKGIGLKLSNNEQTLVAIRQLWEVAVKENNGPKETELRQRMHDLMDQSLDLRMESLHLVNKFLSE